MGKRMLNKIVVPLDGSTTAESVIPYIKDLAPRFGSHVDIIGVGMGGRGRRVNCLLDDYIHSVTDDLRSTGIEGEAVLLFGSPADKILDYATQNDVDLIIMATHGRGGITRWWMGSVAEKIVSGALTPVLITRGKHRKKTEAVQTLSFAKILIPLDGSDIGQAALTYAETLAEEIGASISLLQVISPPGAIEASVLGGSDWRRFVKAMHDAAEDYLNGIAEQLSKRGIETTCEVLSGDPADVIIEYAESNGISLIAMSTHGRTGLARWMIGSVTDKVLHGASIPMWLVRSPKMIIPVPKS